MARAIDPGLVSVALVGPLAPELRETGEELNELVRDTLEVFPPDQTAAFVRALRRSLRGARHPETTPEVKSFLSGIVDLNRDPREGAQLVAAGIVRDFARRQEAVADTFGAQEVAEMLQITRQAIHERFKNHKLFGLQVNEGVRFPTWQFDANQPDGVVSGLADVTAVLAESHLTPLDQLYWLTSPKPEFAGETPVEWLRAGHIDDVVSSAVGAGVR